MATIIIVQDNLNQRILYRIELEDEGYRVLTPSDNQEAQQMVWQEQPDLVVLDLHMWDGKGGAVLEEIKNIAPDLPVIIYTASITIPLNPLWSRLAEAYLVKNSNLGPLKQKISEVLKANGWLGNVRELENAIEQGVLLCQGETISIEDLPQHMAGSEDGGTNFYDLPFRQARERFEREYFEEMLSRAEGRVAEAARQAGIPRQYFYEKMKRFDISRR